MQNSFLAHVSCESQGIPSMAVVDCLMSLEEKNVPIHSFLLMRHKSLVAEVYYAPYDAQTPHRMFSVTKSLVSLAIGILVSDGRITLNDKIVKYFPEYLPVTGPHPYLGELTIRQMLSMRTCFDKTTYKAEGVTNWVGSFFTTRPDHRPGMNFCYDTSSTHVLGALVEKLTGQPLLEFLRGRFLNRLGAGKDASILTDPQGVSMGGSGLMMTPRSLLRILWVVSHGGIDEDGVQLLPPDYLKMAVRKHSDTYATGKVEEEMQGYGWQFWRFTHGAFGMFGMGGQLAVCWPDQDLLLVTTADTQGRAGGQQLIFDAFYQYIWPRIRDEALPEAPTAAAALEHFAETRRIISVPGAAADSYSEAINGRSWKADPNPCGITQFSLSFGDGAGVFTYTNATGRHELLFAFGENNVQLFPDYNQRCAVSAGWHDPHVLIIRAQIIDTSVGSVTFTFSFDHDRNVTVSVRKVEETMFNEYNGTFSAKLEPIAGF